MNYGHLYKLKVVMERMGQNLKCMNCFANLNQWIEIKWWSHGNLGIVFHTQSNIFLIEHQTANDKTNVEL